MVDTKNIRRELLDEMARHKINVREMMEKILREEPDKIPSHRYKYWREALDKMARESMIFDLSHVQTVDDLQKRTDRHYIQAVFDRHFKSPDEAKEIEMRAQAGDDLAMMRMGKFWQDAYHTDDKSWTNRALLVPRFLIAHIVDPETAEIFKKAAKDAYNIEAIDFLTSVKLGNRTPLAYHSVHGVPDLKSPYFRYKADDPLGRVSREHISSKASNHQLSVKTYDHTIYGYPSYSVKNYPTELKTRFDRAIPLLEECAKAGSAEAAKELAGIYKVRDWHCSDTKQVGMAPRIGKSTYSQTIEIQSPYFNLGKADYWDRVAKMLSGAKTDERLLKEFIFSQDDTAEGLYNIGVALLDNSTVRTAYNKQTGKPEDSRTAANDFLKHSANAGNANAAWKCGDLWQRSDNNDPKNAVLWYQIAADLGHPNAKYRVGYLTHQHGKSPVTLGASGRTALVNPTREHRERYPASVGAIPVTDYDFSFLSDPRQGDLLTRIRRAVDLSDKQVAEFDSVVKSLQAKIEMMLREAVQKAGSVEAVAKQIDASFANNTEIQRQIGHDERRQMTVERWIAQEASKIAAGAGISMLTGGASGPISVARTLGDIPNTLNEHKYLSEKIAENYAGLDNILLQVEKQDLLREDIDRLNKLGSVMALQKDQAAVQRLLKGYLRRQVLEMALQNCEYLDKQVKRGGEISIDAFLGAYEHEAQQSGSETKGRVFEALRNFCLGFADTDDLNIMLAYSDTITAKAGATPVTTHDKMLNQFVERHIKPSIDDYASKCSRMDVLKSAQFSLDDVRGILLDPQQDMTNKELAALVHSNFASEGSLQVNRIFDFYLHRHGGKHLYQTRLNDGMVTDETEPKAVRIWSEDKKGEFIDRAIHSYKHDRISLPGVDSIFLRVCAAEYFEPQSVITSGSQATFRENSQAPIAYPMANDVINDFIERMSLSPFGKYRAVMEDKRDIDALIAQSFIDYFSALGHLHTEKFAKERGALAKSYDLKAYGTRFRDCYNTITDDALERYDLFQIIFEKNLQKTIDTNTHSENSVLLAQLDEVKRMGAKGLNPPIIMPGSEEALQRAIRGNRHFENMRPPSGGIEIR